MRTPPRAPITRIRRHARWTLAVSAALVGMATFASAAPGDRDDTFADYGERVTPYFAMDGLAVDTDGRVLVSGIRSLGDASSTEVARYSPDGAPDPTFGRNGLADLGEYADGAGHSTVLAVAADGRPLVALSTIERVAGIALEAFILLRLTEAGTIDRSFGTSGAVRLFAHFDERFEMRLFPHADGSVRIAGFVCGATTCAVRSATFDERGDETGGFVTPFDLDAPLRGSVVEQPAGRLVAASISDASRDGALRLDLVRYRPDGDREGTFATGDAISGIDLSNRGACEVAASPDGSLVVAGTDPAGEAVLARFTADGARDRSFGANGTARLRVAGATETIPLTLVVGPDGRIVFAGGARLGTTRAEWFLAALDTDGTAARDFGAAGHVVRPPTGGVEFVPLLRLLPDGRFVVAGRAGTTFIVARYEGFPRACGDADGSGAIGVTDGVQVLRASAGLPSSCLAAFCDADESGAISVTDAVRVLRAAASLPAALACGGE